MLVVVYWKKIATYATSRRRLFELTLRKIKKWVIPAWSVKNQWASSSCDSSSVYSRAFWSEIFPCVNFTVSICREYLILPITSLEINERVWNSIEKFLCKSMLWFLSYENIEHIKDSNLLDFNYLSKFSLFI